MPIPHSQQTPQLRESSPLRKVTGSPSSGPARILRVDGPANIAAPHHRPQDMPTKDANRAGADRGATGISRLGADSALGFLAVAELADRGFVGGYLLTDLWGRPLEFQCTTPVKPNRAQEILYGSALHRFVFGELIAATLVAKAGLRPAVVLTEHQAVLAMRPHADVPVVWLDSTSVAHEASGVRNARVHAVTADRSEPSACWQPRYHHLYPDDLSVLGHLLDGPNCLSDLQEPLRRVHLCFDEVYS